MGHKAKINGAGIPYPIRTQTNLPDRLDSVLHVVDLVFNAEIELRISERAIEHQAAGQRTHSDCS